MIAEVRRLFFVLALELDIETILPVHIFALLATDERLSAMMTAGTSGLVASSSSSLSRKFSSSSTGVSALASSSSKIQSHWYLSPPLSNI